MSTSAYRRSMLAGVVFVALFVVGVFTANDGPDTSSSDSASTLDHKWVEWFSHSNNRAEHVIGAYLLIFAALAFIWFCLGLRERLEVSPAERVSARFVSALSVLGAGALAAAAMTAAVIAGAVNLGGEKAPTTGDASHWLSDLTYPFMFVVFGIVSAALIGAIALAALRSGVLPRWTAYFGVLAALGGLFAVIFLPMVLVLLWYLAVAIAGLVRPVGQNVSGSPGQLNVG